MTATKVLRKKYYINIMKNMWARPLARGTATFQKTG
jgi:hypothetical protein